MAQATSRSVRLRPREQFWLDHLRADRQQRQTLKAYAQTHGLSLSALYTARSTLKRRGALREPATAAPTFVPVRIAPAGAAIVLRLDALKANRRQRSGSKRFTLSAMSTPAPATANEDLASLHAQVRHYESELTERDVVINARLDGIPDSPATT